MVLAVAAQRAGAAEGAGGGVLDDLGGGAVGAVHARGRNIKKVEIDQMAGGGHAVGIMTGCARGLDLGVHNVKAVTAVLALGIEGFETLIA